MFTYDVLATDDGGFYGVVYRNGSSLWRTPRIPGMMGALRLAKEKCEELNAREGKREDHPMAQMQKIQGSFSVMWVVFDGFSNGMRNNARGFYNESDAIKELNARNTKQKVVYCYASDRRN